MSDKKSEPGCATYAGLGVLVLCAFLVLLIPVFWVACEIRKLIVDNPGDDGFGLTDREYEALRDSDDTSMTKRVQQSVNNRFAAWKKAHSRVWGARAGLASAAVLFAVFPVLFTDYLMAPLQSPSDMMEAWVQMSVASVPTLIAAGIGYFAGSYFASDFADNYAPESVHQLAGKYEQRRDRSSSVSSPQAATASATGEPGPSQDDEELGNVELTIAQSTCILAGYVLRADGELTTSEEQSARLLTEIVIPQEMDTQSQIQEMMRLIKEGDWSEGAAKTACNILSTADETRRLAIAQMTEIVGQTEPMTTPKKRALREVLTWLDAPQDRIRTAGEPSKRDDSGDVTSANSTGGDPDKEDVANVVLNSLALACGHILWANREFYPQDRQLVKLILDGVAPKVFDNPDDAPDTDELLDTLETGTPKTDYVKQGCGILASMEEYRDVFMELMTKVAVQSPGDMAPKKKALQEVLTWLDATPGEIHQIFSMIDEA